MINEEKFVKHSDSWMICASVSGYNDYGSFF